jgi:mono/diheme cytochrome c family protein
MNRFARRLAFLALLVPAAAYADTKPPASAPAASGPAAGSDASAGKALYDKNCASCHGADGRGTAAKAKVLKIEPELLNLGRAETAKLTRDDQKKVLLSGKGKMPAYQKKLKATDVDPVLDYALHLAAAIRK